MHITRAARARPIGPCAGRACMPPAAARARNGRGRNRTRRRIRRRAHKARRRARSLVRRLTCCTSRRSAALATHTAPRLLAALPRTEAASAASSGWSSPPPTTADTVQAWFLYSSSGLAPARARQHQSVSTGRCPPGPTYRERGRGVGGRCAKEEEDTRVGSRCGCHLAEHLDKTGSGRWRGEHLRFWMSVIGVVEMLQSEKELLISPSLSSVTVDAVDGREQQRC